MWHGCLLLLLLPLCWAQSLQYESIPFTLDPVPVPGLVQAENYDRGGSLVAYQDSDAENKGNTEFRKCEGVDIGEFRNGSLYVGWTRPQEWLQYTLDVQATDDYILFMRYAAAPNPQSPENLRGIASIRFDNGLPGSTFRITGTGGWDSWRIAGDRIILAEGIAKMNVRFFSGASSGNVDVMNLDWLRFVTPYFGSDGPRPIPGRIEAEDFDLLCYDDHDSQNRGGAYRPDEPVDIQPTTDTTGEYNVGWTDPYEFLCYTVVAETTGMYVFSIRVASRGVGGDFAVQIGDTFVGRFTVPDTGDWQSWVTLQSEPFPIFAGRYRVTITMLTAGESGAVGNINFFTVDLVSESIPNILYIRSDGTLSPTAGPGETLLTLSEGDCDDAVNDPPEATQYFYLRGVNAHWSISLPTRFSVLLSTASGSAVSVQAQLAYDFEGDGFFDRTEFYLPFEVEGDESVQEYTHEVGFSFNPGTSHRTLTNGVIRFGLWIASGCAPVQVHLDRPADADPSHLYVPYDI